MLQDSVISEKSVILIDVNGKPINLLVAQATRGNVVTTIAGNVFTAPNKQPFCLCNETVDDSTVVLSVVFADDPTNTPVLKRFKSGDNIYVLKSFTMPNPAVALFYLQ